MTSRYFVTPKANRDLDEILTHLTDESGVEKALQFLVEAQATFQLLATHSGIGWKYRSNHHQLRNIRVFRVSSVFENYLVFYRLVVQEIEIIRILHGSRDLNMLLSEFSA